MGGMFSFRALRDPILVAANKSGSATPAESTPSDPTPPASRSALVNVDQLAATVVITRSRATTNPVRYPVASSAPMSRTASAPSQAARVWVS